MSTLLQHLTKDSILLMYAAGELPAEDRAEVEQMLAHNPALRDELERLRSAYDGVGAALHEADAAERLALPANTAGRRVGQAVRSWHARRMAEPQSGREGRRFRLPRWAYPIAAAAALVLGYTVWWGFQSDPPSGLVGQTQPSPTGVLETKVLSEADRLAIIGPWEDSLVLRDPGDDELDAAEDELYALSESSLAGPTYDDGGLLPPAAGETDER